MLQANQYCEDHYLSAFMFPFVTDLGYVGWNNTHPDSQFDVWNRHSDHDYCHCLSGGYRNAEGRTRFYFRCPVIGENTPALCRQMVFTAENRLQDGFGDNRTVIWEF